MQCIDPKTRAGRAAGLPGLGALAGAAVLALTAGCTLGPQYEGPPEVAQQAVSAAQPVSYTHLTLPTKRIV